MARLANHKAFKAFNQSGHKAQTDNVLNVTVMF